MSFKIRDVLGDGNCYFRCIWNIIKDDQILKNCLLIDESVTTEGDGVREIREFVSICVVQMKKAKLMLKNLLEIHDACPDISIYYPILANIDYDDSFPVICKKVAHVIETTSIMASSFEHDIINSILTLGDLELIVLTQSSDESQEDMMDKWTRQLYKMLPMINKKTIAIIVNVDNVHYKYTAFNGNVLIDKAAFHRYINFVMDIDSDADADSDADDDSE